MNCIPGPDNVWSHRSRGQVGLADPSNQLGYAYLTNYITMYGMGDDPQYLDLEKALYECLDDFYLSFGSETRTVAKISTIIT